MRAYRVLGGWPVAVLWFLLGVFLPCCAGKKPVPEDARASELGEYLLFVSNVQGNPLCLFGSIQKASVRPWFSSERTRWRAHAWLVFPGGAAELFSEWGKRKQDPSAPLLWTRDTLLLTAGGDRLVFYQPLSDDKLLLLTDPIFPERVRRSGEEDVRYTLLPASLVWNDRAVQGRVLYQELRRGPGEAASGFLPLHGPRAGTRSYAIWVSGGMFLYVERLREPAQAGRSAATAVMQDRRGRWEETYNVLLSEPEDLFAAEGRREEGGGGVRPAALGLDIPFWRIQGTLEPVTEARVGQEPGTGPAGEPDGPAARSFWRSVTMLHGGADRGPVRFCVLKGTLRVDGEPQSVYGVGITEP